MPGCTKRYTDPSSLRKHVKNHSVTRNKRKPRKDELLLLPMSQNSALSNFDDINFDLETHNHYVPQETHSFITTTAFNNSIDHNDLNKLSSSVYNKNAMNLMEISKCILGMENEDQNYSFNLEKTTANKLSTCDTDDGDEFVSIENIKKYLGERNMDYIDVTLQNHLNTDYFGGLR